MGMKKIIALAMRRLGVSRYELSKRLGISDQALAYIARKDARAVRISVLCRLREVLDISWAEFGGLLDGEFSGE